MQYFTHEKYLASQNGIADQKSKCRYNCNTNRKLSWHVKVEPSDYHNFIEYNLSMVSQSTKLNVVFFSDKRTQGNKKDNLVNQSHFFCESRMNETLFIAYTVTFQQYPYYLYITRKPKITRQIPRHPPIVRDFRFSHRSHPSNISNKTLILTTTNHIQRPNAQILIR